MKVLVTFGSKRGGTAELAEEVARGLDEAGHEVEVWPAKEVEGLQEWDAVVVGGALYAWNWTRDARRFVKRHARQLQYLPVWFFSSGPLDYSASHEEIPPTWPVRRLSDRVEARGHVTFGGRMEDESMSQLPQGDWRDFDAARDWGGQIGKQLDGLRPPDKPLPRLEVPWERRGRAALVALCMFTGVTALAGGLDMVIWPEGRAWFDIPISVLDGTPFSDFLLPGILLLAGVGLPNLVAGILSWRRHRFGEIAGFGAGGALTVWMSVEMAMMNSGHWLQWFYLGVGVVTMIVAFLLWAKVRGPAVEAGRRISG